MRTGIIHIGAHKTGSTSIQASLKKSKDLLRSHGILYFDEYDRSVQLLSMGLRNRREAAPIRKGTYQSISEMKSASLSSWTELHRKVRRENVSYTIISEEFLLRLQNTDHFKRILDQIFDRVFIVVYVRDPAKRLPSSVDQRIRGGATVEELIGGRSGLPRLLPKLERYATTFGKNSLIVRNFDHRNLKNGSPVNDFAHILSTIVGIDIELADAGHRNPSMPGSVTSFLLSQNKAHFLAGKPEDTIWFRNRKRFVEAIQKDVSLMSGEKLRLSEPLLSGHIWNVFSEEVAAINERYLSNQVQIEFGSRGEMLTKARLIETVEQWVLQYEDDLLSRSLSKLSDLLEVAHQ